MFLCTFNIIYIITLVTEFLDPQFYTCLVITLVVIVIGKKSVASTSATYYIVTRQIIMH